MASWLAGCSQRNGWNWSAECPEGQPQVNDKETIAETKERKLFFVLSVRHRNLICPVKLPMCLMFLPKCLWNCGMTHIRHCWTWFSCRRVWRQLKPHKKIWKVNKKIHESANALVGGVWTFMKSKCIWGGQQLLSGGKDTQAQKSGVILTLCSLVFDQQNWTLNFNEKKIGKFPIASLFLHVASKQNGNGMLLSTMHEEKCDCGWTSKNKQSSLSSNSFSNKCQCENILHQRFCLWMLAKQTDTATFFTCMQSMTKGSAHVGRCVHLQPWCLWSSHFEIHCKQQQLAATTTQPQLLANWTVSSNKQVSSSNIC